MIVRRPRETALERDVWKPYIMLSHTLRRFFKRQRAVSKVCANAHGTIRRRLNEFQIRGNNRILSDLMSMRGSLLVLQKSDACCWEKDCRQKHFSPKVFSHCAELWCSRVRVGWNYKRDFRVCNKNYIREYVCWRETFVFSDRCCVCRHIIIYLRSYLLLIIIRSYDNNIIINERSNKIRYYY